MEVPARLCGNVNTKKFRLSSLGQVCQSTFLTGVPVSSLEKRAVAPPLGNVIRSTHGSPTSRRNELRFCWLRLVFSICPR